MLEGSKLNGDINNLNGLLLIKAYEATTGLHYFSVVSQEREAFFALVNDLSKIMDKNLNEGLDKLIENAEKQDKRTGHSHDLELLGLDLYSEHDINHRVTPQTKIDMYDLGFVLNLGEYDDNKHKVANDYFFAYNQQQADRDSKPL